MSCHVHKKQIDYFDYVKNAVKCLWTNYRPTKTISKVSNIVNLPTINYGV
jgi:hypothetical protein